MRIPKTIYHLKSNIMFGIGLVLFVFFFNIIYTPNYGLSEEVVSLSDMMEGNNGIVQWYQHQGLCLPICCAIILVVVALSRTLLVLTTRTARLRESDYLWWQLIEVFSTSLFINLFLSLYMHQGFFGHLPMVILIYISVCIYPYAFYWLLAERIDRDVRLASASHTIMQLRRVDHDDSSSMLRFADEKGTVRLVLSIENIVSIEAAGNYVTLLYLNANRLTRYSLRNTLKGIEPLCENTTLIRCHRSYYINLQHVRLLRKSPDGLLAEIDVEGVAPVPVSKSYATDVTARFSKN